MTRFMLHETGKKCMEFGAGYSQGATSCRHRTPRDGVAVWVQAAETWAQQEGFSMLAALPCCDVYVAPLRVLFWSVFCFE